MLSRPMPEPRRCASCGKELSSQAPVGLCVDCLLSGALPQSGAASDSQIATEIPGSQPDRHERVGSYRLLRQLGEGGCGIVYLAEQEEPVRRRVALKVIKPGMDTRQVLARFEA